MAETPTHYLKLILINHDILLVYGIEEVLEIMFGNQKSVGLTVLVSHKDIES